MIKVKIFRDKTAGKIVSFDVSGHSGTAPHGFDIICAGVSSLTQSALLGLGDYLNRDVDFDAASGKLSVKLKGAPDDLTEAILRTMLLGLKEIAKVNPEATGIEIIDM